MQSTPAFGYWMRRPHVVAYSPFREVLEREEAAARIVECEALDDLYTRSERIAAVKLAAARTLELMLTLSYAAELSRESVAVDAGRAASATRHDVT